MAKSPPKPKPDPQFFSISPLSTVAYEGDTGTTAYTFTISRTSSTGTATVKYKVKGISLYGAEASDFMGGTWPAGTITFLDGETSKIITVYVVGDTTIESDEGFAVTLSQPSKGQIATATATATIQNDDFYQVAITALDAVKAEGNSGTTAYTFTVSRTGGTTDAVSVDYAVTGTGTNAADGADFVVKSATKGGTFPAGTVMIPEGQTSATLTINVAGDTTREDSEGFTVTLTNPSANAQIATATATGTIQNDDPVITYVTGTTEASNAPSEVRSQSISADGHFITFWSYATNLVAGQTYTNWSDIFLYDTQSGTMTNITAGGNGYSYQPSISGDGLSIAFDSNASNLVAGQTDANGSIQDVFVYDTLSGTTTNITAGGNGYDAGIGSHRPSISEDGRFIAYFSNASNLVAGQTDTNGGIHDIFLYDTLSGTTLNITNGANDTSLNPSISADGLSIAFFSNASNLVTGQTDANGGIDDIFLYDTLSGNMTNITAGGNGYSFQPSISGDGHHVAFISNASNLVAGQTDANGSIHDIFLYDTLSGTTLNITNGANGPSINPSISADGHYVTFSSLATNLVGGGTNGSISDIFVYDTLSGTTTNITIGGNANSFQPSISGDGSSVVFMTNATNLDGGVHPSSGYADLALWHL